jgi:enediyne polyketide synthase
MTRHNGIALVSTACRFPDADSCADLWGNVLEGRRSFRSLPKERLDIGRYASGAVGEADSITPVRAGLLTNWRPDHSVFRIPAKTFEATDLTHWLALELAAEAIAAIGGVDRIDRTRTAVVVANTLAGEFSRTSLLRLRAPFLDDVLAGAASKEGLASEAAMRLRRTFDSELRRRFIDPNEDSLAGGLANTIAGRIANYFDLHGGAYSVDAACASSLVALADAANLLVSEQVDAVVVAAVDLSLDPFELVGFSRNRALAADGMRVFDAKANGFWPGEGGACALLMREKDAIRRELPVVARIRGWGLSSDGAGGLTRPSLEGQLTAYRRAYEMADIDPADVDFVEAHGTGTAVGDPIEVLALAALRKGAHTPLPIGSIKANIGHTKAAAGFAGLIKTVEALRYGIVPPHVSCENLHPVFAEIDHQVRPNITCKLIDRPRGAVAGVSSFGFGGINAHLVVEHAGTTAAPIRLPRRPVSQDAELFLFSGNDADEIIDSITTIERRASMLSMAELSDAAAYAASRAQPGPIRVAIVASDGPELAERMARAKTAVIAGDSLAGADGSVFTGRTSRVPRIGFLFPGQGAPCRPDGGSWHRRFAGVDELTARLPAAAGRDSFDTDVVQPGIVAASLAAIDVLGRLGISADAAAGHSLGEISALAWAKVLDREAALKLALKRGSIMARAGSSGGAMLRVVLSPLDAERLAHETGTVVACRNGNAESVLSGDLDAIGAAIARCRSRGVEASELAVSHAFHSPHMKTAADALAETLRAVSFGPVIGATVISTITGAPLAPDSDLRRLLVDQLVEPVLFGAALELLGAQSDYLVEVGPGEGLTRLARSNGIAAFSVDAFGSSIKPLLATVGALFTAGSNIRAEALFEDRSIGTFEPGAVPRFLESPCGSRDSSRPIEFPLSIAPTTAAPTPEVLSQETTPLAVVLSALANETGLQISRISADDRFLDALHLNSLAVTRIVIAAARALRLRLPSAPTEFSNATPRQLADALTELQTFGGDPNDTGQRIAGVRPWVRTYAMGRGEGRLPAKSATPLYWCHGTLQQQTPSAPGPTGDIGLVIRVEKRFGATAAERLLEEVSEAARANVKHLALCHHGAPVSAFARSVAREGYFRSVRVIDEAGADVNDPRVESVLSSDVNGYCEVRFTDCGGIEQPIFAPSVPTLAPWAAVIASDVVVIVGGGKGIAAECAFEIARRGAAIVLVGRSAASDPTAAATVTRAEARGIRCRYVCADVLNADSLRAGLAPVLDEYGPATILLYAPAVNQPKLLVDLDAETVSSAIAPKTTGLETMLEVLGPALRRLVTFGSIIGRIGLEGETHYALANAMQSAATEAWAAASPDRTALAIEWSVWGGIGMGERLGTIERLSAQGVDAISVDDAIDVFGRLMTGGATGTVAVTSRFGPPPDLCLGAVALPMLRFLDEPKVHFPGVELVIETSLNRGRDLYLDDHIVGGVAVLPAVIGLEAMAQTAFGLAPHGSTFTVSDITLSRAVSVFDAGATRIRMAALRSEQGTTDVQLFADDDGFAAPCMQASFRSGRKAPTVFPEFGQSGMGFPAQPLYGSLFFNGTRFQRIECFEIATSRQVAARLTPDPGRKWFGSFEPASFVLWDPGATDAVLHALQVAVPHRRVLPVSVERIEIDSTAGPLKYVSAIERKTAGRTYTFDLFVGDENGRLAQHWINATFRAVEPTSTVDILLAAPALASSYLERAVREALGDCNIRISLVCDRHSSRESRRDAAIANLGLGGTTERRGDGKLVRADGRGSISIAHREDLTLAVTASVPVGCDIELSSTDESIDFIRRHAALEACRKIGRKPSAASLPAIIPGIPIRIDGMNIFITELMLPSGSYTVAVCRPEGATRRQPAGNHSPYNEVAL